MAQSIYSKCSLSFRAFVALSQYDRLVRLVSLISLISLVSIIVSLGRLFRLISPLGESRPSSFCCWHGHFDLLHRP